MSETTTFGERLATLREARRLSLNRLAKLAGIDHSSVSRYESGHRHPTYQTIRWLASAMQLGAEETDRLATLAGYAPSCCPACGHRITTGHDG